MTTPHFAYAEDYGYERDYGHNYLAILRALEHVLLYNPQEAQARREVPCRFLVPFDRYEKVLQHLREAGQSSTTRNAWLTKHSLTLEALEALESESANLVYVPIGLGEIEHPIKTYKVDAACAFRYGDCTLRPAGPSANGYYIDWDIALDILINSETTEHADPDGGHFNHPGIYTPYRGMLVDAIVTRFLTYPVLELVTKADPAPAFDSRTAWEWSSRWKPISLESSGQLSYLFEQYTQWTDKDIAFELLGVDDQGLWIDGTQAPVITSVKMGDKTDINYWMSLYATGLNDSLKGYWPTTINIRVCEHRTVPVGSMGWAGQV